MWRKHMMRAALLSAAALTMALPANAGWEGPWGEKPFWERSEPRHSPSAKSVAKKQTESWGAKPSPKSKPVYAEEVEEQPAPKPKAKSKAAAKAAPKQPAPELVQGGPRPDITPKAPETVAFNASYPVGSIVIDTAARKLYYVKSGGLAFRYPVAVGKVGFTWTGTEAIARKQEWPDWYPPAEMRERKPELPERMTGGVNNPLGAMALYLGNSLYRIHGTSDASSIGTASSSGCFRMHNAHVVHLASLAGVGTQVTVVKSLPSKIASAD